MGSIVVDFIYKNKYPEAIINEWPQVPEDGQRVEVDYGKSTNNFIWWKGGKFVNKYGFDIYNVIGWRPYVE